MRIGDLNFSLSFERYSYFLGKKWEFLSGFIKLELCSTLLSDPLLILYRSKILYNLKISTRCLYECIGNCC